MIHPLYELYDSLTMLISPSFETAFDQVERWSAKLSSRRRADRRVGLEQHTRLWNSEAKFDEAHIGRVSALSKS